MAPSAPTEAAPPPDAELTFSQVSAVVGLLMVRAGTRRIISRAALALVLPAGVFHLSERFLDNAANLSPSEAGAVAFGLWALTWRVVFALSSRIPDVAVDPAVINSFAARWADGEETGREIRNAAGDAR